MVIITCALKYEAKPIIQEFKLTHLPEFSHYKVYKNEDLYLIITGVGKVKAATAIGFFLGKIGIPDFALNIGICGSATTEIPIGTSILANRIYDESSDRSFFSKINFSHHFKEISLYTYDRPVKFKHLDPVVVDMEASGFFQSANKFLQEDKIFAIKVVSDHLEGEKLEPDFVESLIEKKLSYIQDFISNLDKKSEPKHLSTLDMINLNTKEN